MSKDNRFLARDSDPDDFELIRSEGSYLIGPKGNRYIDFFMGWNVGNLGWGNTEIQSRLRKYDGPGYVYPGFKYKPWNELAELLASIAPGKLRKTFRATGGTEAVDFALRLAMIHTGRHKFVSIKDCYHGNSVAALSVAPYDEQKWPKNLLFRCDQVEAPLDSRAADEVEKLLKKRDVAAFIMEPVVCNLAVQVPHDDFMMRIQHLCRKYGTLLIMDEVATGFGRTGKLFATEHYGIEPDIMTLAKAITGGYAGMGATMTTEAVAKSAREDSSFYSTYGWHPLSVEAALANIGYILAHREVLLGHVAEMSHYFLERLSRLDFRHPAEIRVKGLAIGIEFESGGHGARIYERARKKGLLLGDGSDDSLTLFPALNIEKEVARKGLDILEECCDSRRAQAA